MVWNTLPPTSVDANSVIDETLMDAGLKNNDDDHETRILALEGGGSGSGSGGFDGAIAKIIAGGKKNVDNYRIKRFSPAQNTVGNGANQEGNDFFGKNINDRFIYNPSLGALAINVQLSAASYMGMRLSIPKDGKQEFKIKKGENFFTIGYDTDPTAGDGVEVFIDGATPTSLGLVDETGAPANNSFATNSALKQGLKEYYFGLDGEEHVITILNNSTTNVFLFAFIEVGHLTKNPSLNHSVNIKAGRASGRFGELNFVETDLTFQEPIEGKANGHTGAIVINNSGTLEALDGESPAMIPCRPGNIAFSGAVTTLAVLNNYFFPTNGICLFALPTGQTSLFSYGAKTNTTVQAHSLDSIIWQAKPTVDFSPLANLDQGLNQPRGDAMINYIGTAPILIDATNNKVDFQVVLNGVTTLHAATLVNGRYAADIVHLEKAFNTAMQTAKAINGKYFLNYNADSQLWSIGCDDAEVTEIQFLWQTGANSSAALAATIGFNISDLTGKISYAATNAKQHLCARVHAVDREFMPANHPDIKHNFTQVSQSATLLKIRADIEGRLGFGYARFAGTGVFAVRRNYIHPAHDCTGLDITVAFLGSQGCQMAVRIDNGQPYYTTMTQNNINTVEAERAQLITTRITFPKGTRMIELLNIDDDTWIRATVNNAHVLFVGCRQLFTKPAWEKLPLTKSIIDDLEIWPLSMYVSPYTHNSGLLYVQGAGDNVDAIAESVPWAADAATSTFAGTRRSTGTLNNFVDIDFTITGVGGFMYDATNDAGGMSTKVGIFLNTQAAGITEGTDRVRNYYNAQNTGGAQNYDEKGFEITGLPAGSYVARIKREGATNIVVSAFFVIDTVIPDPDKYNVSDLQNNGQGLPYPYSSVFHKFLPDSGERVPRYLYRSGYKEGRVTNIQQSIFDAASISDHDDVVNVTSQNFYWASDSSTMSLAINHFFKFFATARSIQLVGMVFNSTYSTNVQPSYDGSATASSINGRVAVKNGSASTNFRDAISRLSHKIFEKTCSLSVGNTYLVNDTTGMKDGQNAILEEIGVNEEVVIITNIVTDVSFDIKKTPLVVTPANVDNIKFYGLKSLKIEIIVADGAMPLSGFSYEPLPLTSSKSIARLKRDTITETKTVTFKSVANGDDLYYPVHSDGNPGNWLTSSIDVTAWETASGGYTINEDLKNISIGGGTLDLKITSIREVPKQLRIEEAY